MKEIYEILKTEDNNQALRRAVVFFGANPKITLDKIKELIKLANVNSQDDNAKSKKTALHLAVTTNKLVLVETLLIAGARYDIEDADGKTALCYAVVKPIQPQIKKRMLLALATDSVANIVKLFKFVSDIDRDKTQNKKQFDEFVKRMNEKANEITRVVSNYIFALLTFGKGGNSTTPHLQAKAKLKDLIICLAHLDSYIATFKETQFNLNYCGLMTWQLCCELYKHKSVRNGQINVKQITLFTEKGNHGVVLINGGYHNNTIITAAETILCNPFKDDPKRRVIYDEAAIDLYFDPENSTIKNDEFEIDQPKMTDLLYSQETFSALLKGMEEAVLKEIYTDKKYGGYVRKHLNDFFMKLYAEAIRNGLLEQFKSHEMGAPLLSPMEKLFLELQKEVGAMQSQMTVQYDSKCSEKGKSSVATSTIAFKNNK